MPLRDPVLEKTVANYVKRMLNSISRSAVLKAFPTRAVKRVDLDRFRIADAEAPESLVRTLVQPEGRYRLAFQDYRRPDERGEESRALFTTLRTKLARAAQAAHRETGLWMLWLAYPLLYVPHPSSDREEYLLSPLFLWPIRIESDGLPEGELFIARERGAPRFNRIAWQWIRRNLEFDPPEPDGVDLLEMANFDALRQLVIRCCGCFRPALDVTLGPHIQPIPERTTLASFERHRLLDAGIVGLIQWENMELIADLEKLSNLDDFTGPAGDFIRERMESAAISLEIPPEKDRFLVTDTDDSQERAVWMARCQPGVVVHGPPGTGKSQVIVNIVADALARGEKVLVVCQKKAALDVVSSRLRAVGLEDFAIQVDDAESDRRRIVEMLRDQEMLAVAANEQERTAIAEEIETIEKQVQEYAESLFRARRGISYRSMVARIARIERQYDSACPLEALREILKDTDETELARLSSTVAQLEKIFWDGSVAENPWVNGRADLDGDPFQIKDMGADLECALRDAVAVDLWAGMKGPHNGKLIGNLKTISDAAKRLATAWPKLDVRIVAGVKPAQETFSNIDETAYVTAARAVEGVIEKQRSLFRYLSPFFYRRRKIIRGFAASHDWSVGPAAKSVFDAMARRSEEMARCEPLIKAVAKWLNENEANSLIEAIRIIRPIRGRLRRLKDYLPKLPILLRYVATVKGLNQRGQKVIEALERTPGGPPQNWSKIVEISALLSWVGEAERDSPILRRLTPEIYESAGKRLRELSQRKRQLERQAIRTTWGRKWPLVDHTWRKALRFRGPKSRRLREIVEMGCSRGLLDLKPCWLANPGTVSQIFPLQPGLFDLVIFDEASQCPPEYALPALFRGKRVVVAGDGKQLPPTMFFKAAFDFDPDEMEESEEGVQENLQLGISIGAEDLLSLAQVRLPEAYLNVHYRSRDPMLIAFSNAAFYRNRLQVPQPACPVTQDGTPALFLERVDGVYQKNRTNPEEAKCIVGYLRRVWLGSGNRPTMGVVTFNEAQREAIEELLDAEVSRDPEFRAAYEQEVSRTDAGQDVGFFVKSLEAVQGDERDVVLFSTTYGRRDDGKFTCAFLGPVNQQGGERRLNVAITRAKLWVRIFTSLPIHELASALSPGTIQTQPSAGRAMLQLYLHYAECVSSGRNAEAEATLARALALGGGLGEHQGSVGGEESEFEIEVREALSDFLHLQIDTQVSSGSFRIDLAVRASDNSGYVLGIECDGKAYHSGLSARAYDYWRQRILEDRGWKIHRVWSSAWRTERVREISKIQARLEDILKTTRDDRAQGA